MQSDLLHMVVLLEMFADYHSVNALMIFFYIFWISSLELCG